jgi:hypothetical protein
VVDPPHILGQSSGAVAAELAHALRQAARAIAQETVATLAHRDGDGRAHAGSGSASVAELLPVSGFAPDVTFYYEVTATNALGSTHPSEGSFSASQERFASPSGSSLAPCTLAAPCDLATAVNGASNGEEVVLASGSYGTAASPLTTPLRNPNSIVIDGANPAPQLFLSTPGHQDLQLVYFSRVTGIDLFETGASDEGAFITGVFDHDLVRGDGGGTSSGTLTLVLAPAKARHKKK